MKNKKHESSHRCELNHPTRSSFWKYVPPLAIDMPVCTKLKEFPYNAKKSKSIAPRFQDNGSLR